MINLKLIEAFLTEMIEMEDVIDCFGEKVTNRLVFESLALFQHQPHPNTNQNHP